MQFAKTMFAILPVFLVSATLVGANFRFITESLPEGLLGSAYSATLETEGGTGTASFAIGSGSLPDGLTLDAGVGTVSGVPTKAGTFPITFTAQDSKRTIQFTTSMVVIDKSFHFTTTTVPEGTIGSAYSVTLETENAKGAVTYGLKSGLLPNGLELNATSGTVSGTPTETGSFPVVFQASDGVDSADLAATFRISVASAFRFLTTSLPEGTTNAEYSGVLLVANQTGPVTFSVASGTLPNGLDLSSTTGQISGRPTVVNQFSVNFGADDGNSAITFETIIKISASGGGGNAGTAIDNTTLVNGRIGIEYAETIHVSNGIGPFVYCSDGLPSGLSLNGATGAISGIPKEAGTFYVAFSVTDPGENDNKIVKTLPLTILPAMSDFRFTMSLLANGEIGTDYNDQWTTEGSTGASVSFSASGLPEGLSLDSETGIVSGIPSIAGTFPVTVTASDGTDTIFTNRRIWIVPTPDSEFYWTFSGLPAALFGIEYGRQPPLTVSAANGTLVTYSATGLPSGIEYNATTGELSGSTVEIGIYPVKFTAIDGANTETIVLPFDFIVLPATGGDAKDLPVNLWALRQQIKGGVPGKDSWKASYLYNADRRSGKSFDPETQEFFVSIGNREISLPPGSFIVSASGVMNYRSDKSAIPKVTVKITPAKQNIQLSTAKDTINQTVPATTRNVLMIGNKSYRIDEAFDAKGKLTVPSGYRSTCFVLSDGQIILKGAGKDTAKFNFLLGDPAFACAQGTPIEFTVQDGEGTYIAKPDFSDLLSVQQVTVKDIEVCKIKQSGKDATPDTTLKKFSYTTQTGKMSLSLANMTITGLSGEKHLLFELRIGDKTYTTTVTFFERSPGKFATKY